jgi:HK97 gp10 family phage protein
MYKVNVTGILGRYRYTNLPDDMANTLVRIGVDQAALIARQKSPVLSGDLKAEIHTELVPLKRVGYVFVEARDIPYVFAAEFGSRRRLAHPFMRPAQKSAKSKISAIIRKVARDAIAKEKSANGNR